MIKASELDRRIRIERDGKSTHNGVQNVTAAPVILAKPWAKYIGSPGRERYESAEKAASAPGLFRIRWSAQLDPDAPDGLSAQDRIRHPARDDGQLYEIVSIQPYGRRDGIDIGVVRIVR